MITIYLSVPIDVCFILLIYNILHHTVVIWGWIVLTLQPDYVYKLLVYKIENTLFVDISLSKHLININDLLYFFTLITIH